MRDFFAFCTLMAFVTVTGLSVFALFKPLPRVWLGTRKRALTGFGVAFGLFILTAIIMPPPDPEKAAAETPSVATTAKVEEKSPRPVPMARPSDPLPEVEAISLPSGAPPAPISGLCAEQRMCAANSITFERRDWPKAWAGDYQGQRNAAFCRSTGCDGAVEINQAEACAWRAIIIQAHPMETNDADSSNLKLDCGQLDPAALASATRKAEVMFERIYGKKMAVR